MQVLVVCSGNICRSPIGEALLGKRLAGAGIEAQVGSAGLLTVDRPAEPEVVELMAAMGIDVSGHRSRLVTAELVTDSDLVIGMAREHVREIVMVDPGAFGRTFALKELVRLGEMTGARRAGQPLDEWLRAVGADRSPSQLLGQSELDDVTDPMGRRFKVFRQVADEIDDLTNRLVGLIGR